MLVLQTCLTLWDPVDCSLLGSSVHVISQARTLEWVALSFSRGSSWHRGQTQVSHIAGRFFSCLSHQGSPILHMVVYICGVGNSNPLQYSCLENSMNRGDWQAAVCGITKRRAGMTEWLSMHTYALCICQRYSQFIPPSPLLMPPNPFSRSASLFLPCT